MGICCSSLSNDAKRICHRLHPDQVEEKTDQINKKNLADRIRDRRVVKILFLGTGESGKTTLVKQLRLLYDKNRTISENSNGLFVSAAGVRRFVFQNLLTLVKQSAEFHPVQDPSSPENVTLQELKQIKFAEIMDSKEHWRVLHRLWRGKGVQQTWLECRNLLRVQDSLGYFMEKFDEIIDEGYLPNEEDWLRMRIKTGGILETNFSHQCLDFTVVDVGGQRNERHKWIHAFSKVNLIIWVMAVNEFDQVLFENVEGNRTRDSLEEFSRTVQNKDLNENNMKYVIFMNKIDLYKAKIRKVNIADSFPEYKGLPSVNATNFEEAFHAGINFFEEELYKAAGEKEESIVGVHAVCAMDQSSVQTAFEDIVSLLIEHHLVV